MNLEFTPTLVRSSHEVPDNILMAFTNNNAQYVYMMLATGKVIGDDAHNDLITDILTFQMQGKTVVLTGCKDCKMRAYFVS